MSTYHVLLTRFNVQRGLQVDPRALSGIWLDARMRLFSNITVPSLVAQTRQPDQWLVFFDEKTPDRTRFLFEELRQYHPSLKNVLRAEYCQELGAAECARHILSLAPAATDWLLTTRLDNDDALHPHFIETVKGLCRPGVREFINPTKGLIVAGARLYRKHDFSSPFISCSEPISDCRTVWIDQHQRLARHGFVRQFGLRDAWIQVVHGGNLANQVRGVRACPSSLAAGVMPDALAAAVMPLSIADQLLDNSLGLTRRYIGSAFRRARRMWNDRRTG